MVFSDVVFGRRAFRNCDEASGRRIGITSLPRDRVYRSSTLFLLSGCAICHPETKNNTLMPSDDASLARGLYPDTEIVSLGPK